MGIVNRQRHLGIGLRYPTSSLEITYSVSDTYSNVVFASVEAVSALLCGGAVKKLVCTQSNQRVGWVAGGPGQPVRTTRYLTPPEYSSFLLFLKLLRSLRTHRWHMKKSFISHLVFI